MTCFSVHQIISLYRNSGSLGLEGNKGSQKRELPLREKLFLLFINQALRDPYKAYDIFRQLILLESQQSTISSLKQQLLFLVLLLILQEESDLSLHTPHLQLAEDTAAYLRSHYQEPVSYKELSDHFHFHANYIALCMKNTFGCTPLEYVTRYRIEQAKRMLIYTNEPVGKIAEEAGFGSFPYFIRCFTRYAGMKPLTFRQQYRS
ncbi:MAG: AraC family transcriptional regulator [Paenibacillus sp.]|jgi:YesN/AraC family two-component response regulator|nr:AraC family transcriptional regulator [Paenibacillus sp.]